MDSRLLFLVAFVIAFAVPYIKADGNFTALNYNFTRNDCGKTKLCVGKPTGCDPSGSSECFFTSTKINTINNSLDFEVSGNSTTTGYIAIAAGSNSNVSQGANVVFVCGNNGTFLFKTATFVNGTLTTTTSPNVSNIQYNLIPPAFIQCAFKVPIDFNNSNSIGALTTLGFNATFNISSLATSTIKVFLEVYQGSFYGTSLGQPKSAFGSSISVNLADVNSTNVANTSAPATTATSGSTSLFSLLSHASIALLAAIALHLSDRS